MIGINWFGISLSSREVAVRMATFSPTETIPTAVRSDNHRTLLVRSDDAVLIYHVGPDAPDNLPLEKVSLGRSGVPVAKLVIEMSFASALRSVNFDVHVRHVGGIGTRTADGSSKPGIFVHREGLAFRAFSFQDNRDEVRWGMVLNFAAGQRFIVTLTDDVLRRLAMNKRVAPLVADEADHGGILVGGDRSTLEVAHLDGTTTTEDASQWTAQCRKDLLLKYLVATEGQSAATQVSAELLRASLALTNNGRLNVRLAKDQVSQIQRVLRSCDLTQFKLLSAVNQPLARLSLEPLPIQD